MGGFPRRGYAPRWGDLPRLQKVLSWCPVRKPFAGPGAGGLVAEHAFLHFPADAVHVDPVKLARLPASAQRVFAECRQAGPITPQELRLRTQMPERTVRYAVQRLKEAGMLDTRCSLRDCRNCYFFVHERCVGVAALEAKPGSLPMAP